MFVVDMSAFWLIHFLKPLNVCRSPLTICTSYKVNKLYKHQRRRDWSSGIIRPQRWRRPRCSPSDRTSEQPVLGPLIPWYFGRYSWVLKSG